MPFDFEVQRRLLDAITELTSAAGTVEDTDEAARLANLSTTVTHQKLRVAVIGEFGNGKSTLINSLLGSPVVPTGMTPVTRALFEITYGPEHRAFLIYPDGVRLEVNPNELLNVDGEQAARLERIYIESPAAILEHATLLDVPGLGDPGGVPAGVIDEALTGSDVAVFVLNCDRLLSLTEQSYIGTRLLPCGLEKICFVLNRADGKSPQEIEAVSERARQILEPLAPGARIFPYSALQSLQGVMKQDEARQQAADPERLQDLLREEWLDHAAALQAASTGAKLTRVAASLDARMEQRLGMARERLEVAEALIKAAEAETAALQEQIDGSSRRSAATLEALQEQFVVGLKDFALTLRESVPRQVVAVPVDDARRFLPFYIQDALRRAIHENGDALRTEISQLLDSFPEEAVAGVRRAITTFHVDVEPPAIPLYVPRDKAPLTQGSTYLMMAGALMFSQVYTTGALMLLGSFLSRELGRQLEIADRRANLATRAQTLVHGSIEMMELSLKEQFESLSSSVRSSLQETFASRISEGATTLARLQVEKEEAVRQSGDMASLCASGREHIAVAREAIGEGSGVRG